MSNDREYGTMHKNDKVHLVFAIRRKKENEDLRNETEVVIREIYRDEGSIASVLAKCTAPGIYRLYKTVNSRKTCEARKLLMKKLIDDGENWDYRIDSLWKTCLANPLCKAESNFLIDIDTKDEEVLNKVNSDLIDRGCKSITTVSTPNGFHIVVPKFDTRDFVQQYNGDVEFKRDAYVFMRRVKFDGKTWQDI